MPSSLLPNFIYTTPAVAAVLTLGFLFTGIYVLPPPSPSYPPHTANDPLERYRALDQVGGVAGLFDQGVKLHIHVQGRQEERTGRTQWLGGLLFEDIAQSSGEDVYEALSKNHAFQGKHTLPISVTSGDSSPLFWTATIDESRHEAYLKVVNSGLTSQPLSVTVDANNLSANGTVARAALPEDSSEQSSATVSYFEDVASEDGLQIIVPPFSISVWQFHIPLSVDSREKGAGSHSHVNEVPELVEDEDL